MAKDTKKTSDNNVKKSASKEKSEKVVTKSATTKTAKKSVKDKKSFGKDFKAELKKVTWPTPKQLVNNTIAVVVIVLITAIIVFALDVVFENANKYGVDKLKSIVSNTEVTEEENSEESSDTTVDEVDVSEVEDTTSEEDTTTEAEN